MGFYGKVNPGDPVRHSAGRYNAVSEMLNRFQQGGAPPSSAPPPRPGRIAVYNDSAAADETLEAWRAVLLTGNAIAGGGGPIFGVKRYDGSGEAWGILTGSLAPKACGSAVFDGIAEVEVNVGYLPSDLPVKAYVVPGNNGILSDADSATRCRLLAAGPRDALGRARCAVQLLGTLPYDPAYRGMFCVRRMEGTGTDNPADGFDVEIVDTSSAAETYAGWADLGLGNIVKEVLTVLPGDVVHAILEWSDTAGYTMRFDTALPSGAHGSTPLARIESDGRVTQVWKNGAIYWGARYWV